MWCDWQLGWWSTHLRLAALLRSVIACRWVAPLPSRWLRGSCFGLNGLFLGGFIYFSSPYIGFCKPHTDSHSKFPCSYITDHYKDNLARDIQNLTCWMSHNNHLIYLTVYVEMHTFKEDVTTKRWIYYRSV